MKRQWLLISILLFAGCSIKLLGEVEARKSYILNDLRIDSTVAKEVNLPIVIIRDTTSSRYLSSQKIVFSETPSTRGFYQYATWFEIPTKRFATLLRKRLSQNGYFVSYLDKNRSEVSGFQLNTELIDLYHDIRTKPGEVVAVLNAELVDLNTFRVISRKTFEQKVEVKEYESEGTVEAMNEAITTILDEIVLWMNQIVRN